MLTEQNLILGRASHLRLEDRMVRPDFILFRSDLLHMYLSLRVTKWNIHFLHKLCLAPIGMKMFTGSPHDAAGGLLYFVWANIQRP